jgi:tetratricopeptide (TPR) repeat protein
MHAETWDKAAEEFKTATDLDPLMVVAHYNLGQCRMAEKRYVEAVMAYKRCREAFERQGALSENEREAQERARRDEISELRDSLARVHTLKGVNSQHVTMRIEERIRFLESLRLKGAERAEVPAEIPLALGSAYFRQERLEDAEREYKEAIRLNKKLGAAHNNLAVIYLMTARLDEAEAEARQAEKCGFKLNPQFKQDLKNAHRAAP